MKKIIASLILFCFGFYIFNISLLPLVLAQSTPKPTPLPPTTNYQLPTTNSYTPLPQKLNPQSPQFTNLMFLNVIHTLNCLLVGQSLTSEPCVEYAPIKSLSGVTSVTPVLSSVNTSGGLLGGLTSVLGMMYVNHPLNSGEYFAFMGKELGVVSEANAQVVGSGNNVLYPIITLWVVSRNFSYLFMIIVFLVIGVMVMFRRKINPQTVINVQSAVPGLIIGLILITFSYFFASLISDMSFVATDVVGYYFSQATGTNQDKSLAQELKDENMLSIGSSFVGKLQSGMIEQIAFDLIKNLDKGEGPGGNSVFNAATIVKISVALITYQIGSAVGSAAGATIDTIFSAAPVAGQITRFAKIAKIAKPGSKLASIPGIQQAAAEINGFAGPALGIALATWAFFAPAQWLGYLLFMVALFAVLYAIFRLFITLLNNYLTIIFLTITAPFHFLAASIPGRQGIAVDWFRNMLCNVLAFPAVIGIFYFAAYLLGSSVISAFGLETPLKITPTTSAFPLFGNIDTSFLRILLAFGAILASPKVPDVICKAIGKPGAGGGQLFEQAINQAIGSGQKYAGELQSNIGKTRTNIKEGWNRWKGQDPYGALANKAEYRMRQRGFEVWKSADQASTPEEANRLRKKGDDLMRGYPTILARSTLSRDYANMGPTQEDIKKANAGLANPNPLNERDSQTGSPRRALVAREMGDVNDTTLPRGTRKSKILRLHRRRNP